MLFGNMPLSMSHLISTITADFPFHVPEADQTAFLSRTLERLGRSLNYKVSCARSCDSFGRSGASLALRWWEPGRGTICAAECEWGVAGDVATAFERLMSVKAPLKLLIFHSRRIGFEREDIWLRTDVDAIMKAIGAALLDFGQHVEGEVYLLLERVERESGFRSYEFHVPASGKLSVEFEQAARLFRQIGASPAVAVAAG